MVTIPLSQSGEPAAFAASLSAYAAALAAQRAGKPGIPAPVASPLVASLVVSVSRGDPHPDSFQVLPYTIVDDTPKTAEQEQALAVLRETIK